MGKLNQIGRIATVITSRVENDKAYTVVTYHSTDVVKFNEKKIILNNGGWRTNTTKNRINQTSNQFNLGYNVFQKDFEWFIEYNGKVIPFENNITLKR